MKEAGEVDTRRIFEVLWDKHRGIKTFTPAMDGSTGELLAVRRAASTKLRLNKWKIPEPIDGDVGDPASIDLVIVPLLCFDERGHRVGYGKGYYDRFLKKCRPDCIKTGLSFFPPVDQIDDVHAGDIRLDMCFTPDETYHF